MYVSVLGHLGVRSCPGVCFTLASGHAIPELDGAHDLGRRNQDRYVLPAIICVQFINATPECEVTSCCVRTTSLACRLVASAVSVERIREFSTIPVERDAPRSLARSWPSDGAIVFRDLKMRFRPDTPYVLHGVKCVQ